MEIQSENRGMKTEEEGRGVGARMFYNVPVGIVGDSGISGAINGGKIICQTLPLCLHFPFTNVRHYRELARRAPRCCNDFDLALKTALGCHR